MGRGGGGRYVWQRGAWRGSGMQETRALMRAVCILLECILVVVVVVVVVVTIHKYIARQYEIVLAFYVSFPETIFAKFTEFKES